MNQIGLSLFVVRSHDLDAARNFYEALGLSFTDEQHGSGPRHLSATVGSGIVFELYPAINSDAIERGGVGDVRLGFRVDDLAGVIEATAHNGGTVVSDAVSRNGELVAVLADPEGRRVEISSTVR